MSTAPDAFRARIRRLKAEIAQVIQDAESWNDNHPEHAPIDPDPGGDLAAWNARLDAMLGNLAGGPGGGTT